MLAPKGSKLYVFFQIHVLQLRPRHDPAVIVEAVFFAVKVSDKYSRNDLCQSTDCVSINCASCFNMNSRPVAIPRQAARSGVCELCLKTMDLFTGAYGSEAKNSHDLYHLHKIGWFFFGEIADKCFWHNFGKLIFFRRNFKKKLGASPGQAGVMALKFMPFGGLFAPRQTPNNSAAVSV